MQKFLEDKKYAAFLETKGDYFVCPVAEGKTPWPEEDQLQMEGSSVLSGWKVRVDSGSQEQEK